MEDLTMPERDHRDEAAYSAWQESRAEHYMLEEKPDPDEPMGYDDEPPFDPLHDEPSAGEADPSVPDSNRRFKFPDRWPTEWHIWPVAIAPTRSWPQVTIFVSGQDIIDRAKPDSLVTFTDITHFRSLAVLVARDRIKSDEGWTPDPEPLVVEDVNTAYMLRAGDPIRSALVGVEVTFAVTM